jgi:hypothetical protein
LAAIATIAYSIPHLEFFDISESWADPPTGERIHCLGYPSDLGVIVGAKNEGNREVRDIVLYSKVFSADVLDKQRFTLRDFDPAHHYLVPFEGAANGRSPKGFSGSGAWVERDEKQIIWTPSFRFAGICVASFKSGSILQVIKASTVRRFLQEVFGSDN